MISIVRGLGAPVIVPPGKHAATASASPTSDRASPSIRLTRCITSLYRSTRRYSATSTVPNRETFPRSLRSKSTSMACSARSFSSPVSSASMSASASGVSPRAGASDGLRDEASAVFTLVAVGRRPPPPRRRSERALRVAPGSRSRGRRRTGRRRRRRCRRYRRYRRCRCPLRRTPPRELDQPGVRRRVHRPKRVVRLDRMDRGRGTQSLGDVRLKGVAVADGRLHPTDRLGVPFSTHVALEGRGRRVGGRVPARQRVARFDPVNQVVRPRRPRRTARRARRGRRQDRRAPRERADRPSRGGWRRPSRASHRHPRKPDTPAATRSKTPIWSRGRPRSSTAPGPAGADSGNDSSSRAASYESQPNAPQGTARRSRRVRAPRRR